LGRVWALWHPGQVWLIDMHLLQSCLRRTVLGYGMPFIGPGMLRDSYSVVLIHYHPPPQPPPKCAGNVAFCVEKTVSSFANRPHTAFSSQGHNSPLFYVTPYPCMPAGSQASASRLGIFLRPGALVWFCLHSITTPPCLAQVLSFPHFLLQESS
jgi:hypothetical protein